MAKSKKIKTARKHLEALEQHAEIVSGSTVTMKRAQRANAKLAAAVAAYAEAVERKTGVASPIVAGAYSGLDQSTSTRCRPSAMRSRERSPGRFR